MKIDLDRKEYKCGFDGFGWIPVTCPEFGDGSQVRLQGKICGLDKTPQWMQQYPINPTNVPESLSGQRASSQDLINLWFPSNGTWYFPIL